MTVRKKTTEKDLPTLTIVIEFECFDVDTLEQITNLISEANSSASVTSAKLKLPAEFELASRRF